MVSSEEMLRIPQEFLFDDSVVECRKFFFFFFFYKVYAFAIANTKDTQIA